MVELPVLSRLPALPLEERKDLPMCGAVYFALGERGEVLYIGKAVNLRSRWQAKTHHRYEQLSTMPGVRLAWLVVSEPALLDEIERACIEHFQPALNGTRGIQTRTVRVTLYQHNYDALQAELDRQGLRGVPGAVNVILNEWIARGLREGGYL